MANIVPVKNALLSVYYKDGIVDTARVLNGANVGLYSSGGTANVIRQAGLPVTDVADYTGYPALFGHRVVTLHPKVHGSILYRRDHKQDVQEAQQHGIVPFDLVVVNLYPVEEAIRDPNATLEDVVEKTDIGGPALIRAAAKNHKFVTVVVDPADYMPVAREIAEQGGLTDARRRGLAQKVFERTSAYDEAIATFLSLSRG